MPRAKEIFTSAIFGTRAIGTLALIQSVKYAKGCAVRDSNPCRGKEFFSFLKKKLSRTNLKSTQPMSGSFPGIKRPEPVSGHSPKSKRLKTSAALPQIHLYAFMALARTNLTLTFTFPYRVPYRVVCHRQDVMIIPGCTASHTTKGYFQ